MTTTNNLGITLLEQSQSQKEVTINEALTAFDAMIGNTAISRSVTAPPNAPATGDVYVVPVGATGAWSGKDKKITYFDQIWRFITPRNGSLVWLRDETRYCQYSGAAWVTLATGSGDMVKSTYDPANINQQVVGVTTAQTLTNKTISGASNSLTVRLTNDVSGTLPVASGGTGQISFSDGQLLIGNSSGNTLNKATLTAGSGISITNGAGSVTIAATPSAAPTITFSGDVSGSGTSSITTSIGALKVTNAMLAGSIAANKLVGTDITTVGTITTGTWGGLLGAVSGANLTNLTAANIAPGTAGINITGNAATATSAALFTGALSGDVTGTQSTTVVGKINGRSLAGLATGILKNTTGTGVPSIAVAGTDYQAPITLTTTGTSGAATLVGNMLNIPNYATSSGGTGSSAFSAITGSTNTTAAMIVGSGASLAASGTGTITATAVAAAALTGTALASGVVSSSLTSVGTLTSLATGATTITSSSANALAVGVAGPTNPAFAVDASAASSVTGLRVKSAAAAAGLALDVQSSGANENLIINAKGMGTISIGSVSTGGITLARATSMSAGATVTGGSMGIGTTTPDANAMLDVSSTTKAFLPPRMNSTQKNAIISPTAGLMVYDTTLGKLSIYNGSAWDVTGASAGTSITPLTCEGRLTLTSATPVTISDVTAATTVYFTPYKGSRVALFDGTSSWMLLSFVQTSFAVPATTNMIYDVFAYNNAGTMALETQAWTNDTTRAIALVCQDGVYVKSGATTRRYLGTFRTTAVSGQTEDSAKNRLLWNYYNRVTRRIYYGESTTSWTYSTAAWRFANNGSSFCNFIVGVVEDVNQISIGAQVANSTATARYVFIGIGYNSGGTTINNTAVLGTITSTQQAGITAHVSHMPTSVGFNYYSWLEYGGGADTQMWFGLSGLQVGYLTGKVWG